MDGPGFRSQTCFVRLVILVLIEFTKKPSSTTVVLFLADSHFYLPS